MTHSSCPIRVMQFFSVTFMILLGTNLIAQPEKYPRSVNDGYHQLPEGIFGPATVRNLEPCDIFQEFFYFLSISSPQWNDFTCPENPQTDPNGTYQADNSAFYDAGKLLDSPYSSSSQTNNDNNNHTFWYEFGAFNEWFCADDVDRDNLCDFDDTSGKLGVIMIPIEWEDLNLEFGSSFWINFLTQCENCTNDFSGIGAWHKDEIDLPIRYLSDFILDIPNGIFNGLDIEFQMTVDCDEFSQYGCQADELD